MYVVIVPIQIEQGHRDEFLEALMVDAKGANEDEPGCLRFDAVQDADDDHRIWLYEVYKDEAAFNDHLAAPHFQVFKAAAEKWRVEGIQGSARGSKNLYPSDANWR
ncbi:MAG: antibiotic biosynthesis monooxygenase [Chloroflexi bacterium]|nr:antibiotic biosynthesis monooxygenase [Chloroflexota bacterium]